MFINKLSAAVSLALAVNAATISQMNNCEHGIAKPVQVGLAQNGVISESECGHCDDDEFCYRNTGCISTNWDQQIARKEGCPSGDICSDIGDFRCPRCTCEAYPEHECPVCVSSCTDWSDRKLVRCIDNGSDWTVDPAWPFAYKFTVTPPRIIQTNPLGTATPYTYVGTCDGITVAGTYDWNKKYDCEIYKYEDQIDGKDVYLVDVLFWSPSYAAFSDTAGPTYANQQAVCNAGYAYAH